MHEEKCNANANCDASITRGGCLCEQSQAKGKYYVTCTDKDGNLKWEDTIDNVVCTVGKNVMLDAALAGSPYSVTGPFMGLISSVSYGAGPVVGDTMSSHSGWYEAGTGSYYPLYHFSGSSIRGTCAWAAAGSGSKALSAALAFSIVTTGGTVKGAFIVYGTGAVNTIGDTNGYLYSSGLFSGGDKVLGVGDSLNVSYQTSL
jgi:hypothetical protein